MMLLDKAKMDGWMKDDDDDDDGKEVKKKEY